MPARCNRCTAASFAPATEESPSSMLKFLVPIDGSTPDEKAVKELIRYLGWMNDDVDIHLLNVQPSIPYGNRVTSVIGRERIARFQQEDGLAALKPARKVLDLAKV